MLKKITLLSVLLGLSGCSSYYEMKNCDPEKNYINSNPEAMENYKKLVKNGEVNSYYIKMISPKSCKSGECFSYDPRKYDFKEVYFNDSSRKGVYTIKISEDPNDKKCIKKQYSYDKKCYFVTKNKNDEIKSRFYVELNFDNDRIYKKFMDLKNNTILFESSFQIYKTPNIAGEPSGGFCSIKKNHDDYNFNILAYP